LFILAATAYLDRIPPVWWDEGWTLNVARNWVEFGHYGQLLDGQPKGPGLSASFPVVAPIALSFRLFGIGIWQGRLPSVLFLLGSIMLIFFLAEQLYQRAVAIGAVVVLFFFSGIVQLHPLQMGRTAMGEMPALFFLLSGYTCLWFALRRSAWFIIRRLFSGV
jgi:hypothetical protein